MKITKRAKYIIIISSVLSLFFIILNILPFWLMWAGITAPEYKNQLSLQKMAVQTSVFRYQKIYTRNNLLPTLVLSGDYDTAIKYYKELEILNGADNFNTKLVIYSYINIGDYNEALNYASLIKDKSKMAQIYIKMEDYPKAAILVDELMTRKPVAISTYAYKSELEYVQGNIESAEIYANKVLAVSPAYLDVLYLKAKICKRQGKDDDARKYFNQAKYIDDKRKSLYR